MIPDQIRLLHGGRIPVVLGGAGMPAENPVELWPEGRASAGPDIVAIAANALEQRLTGGDVCLGMGRPREQCGGDDEQAVTDNAPARQSDRKKSGHWHAGSCCKGVSSMPQRVGRFIDLR